MPFIVFAQQRTYQGFTYAPGSHFVDDRLYGLLRETFPAVTSDYEEPLESADVKPADAENVGADEELTELTPEETISVVMTDESADSDELPNDPLSVLPTRVITLLADAGFTSVEAIQAAADETLLSITGIGPSTLASIRAELG